MKHILFLLAFSFVILKVNASVTSDTLIIDSDYSAARITRDLDSLVNSWYVKMAKKNIADFNADTAVPQFPDTVYEQRLGKINSIIRITTSQ
jgi:hypothetical protein